MKELLPTNQEGGTRSYTSEETQFKSKRVSTTFNLQPRVATSTVEGERDLARKDYDMALCRAITAGER